MAKERGSTICDLREEWYYSAHVSDWIVPPDGDGFESQATIYKRSVSRSAPLPWEVGLRIRCGSGEIYHGNGKHETADAALEHLLNASAGIRRTLGDCKGWVAPVVIRVDGDRDKLLSLCSAARHLEIETEELAGVVSIRLSVNRLYVR